MKKFKNTLTFLLFVFSLSCIRQPDEPLDSTCFIDEHGVYILNEGLMGQGNSSLSRFDYATGTMLNNFEKCSQSGFYLGDTANDIVSKGDTIYVVVSTNQKIEVFRASSGKHLRTIRFQGKRFPRKLAILNDSTAFVTDLFDHSITKFNPSTFEIIREHISVGPAPEGISFYENFLFIANSGYGDYLADEAKAGTISVLDLSTLQEITLLKNVPNVIELKINYQTKNLYAKYNHLPKLLDSIGGIVEFNIETLSETRRWIDEASSITISETNNRLYYISPKGVKYLNLNEENAIPKLLIENPNTSEIWYSLGLSPVDEMIWIGNAKNYQSEGEINIYDINSPKNPVSNYHIGVNPNTIVFF